MKIKEQTKTYRVSNLARERLAAMSKATGWKETVMLNTCVAWIDLIIAGRTDSFAITNFVAETVKNNTLQKELEDKKTKTSESPLVPRTGDVTSRRNKQSVSA